MPSCLVLAGLLVPLLAASPAPGTSLSTMGLEARVPRWRSAMDSLGVPGLAVAVVRGDSVVWTGTFGLRDVERGLPVTPRTMFYIASCTKTFVATLAADLDARGVVDLDAPIRRTVPRFSLADTAAADTLTLRDLVSHRAGLRSRAITFGEAFTGDMNEERYWRLLAACRPLGRTSYSNLNLTLAARVLEAAVGSRWQNLLERHLLGPAGMTRTTTSASRLAADSDAAVPYERPGGGLRPAAVRKTDRTMHAAGGMASTLEDLTRWLRLHLADGVVDGRRVLAAGVAPAMRAVEAPVPDRHPLAPDHRRVGFGLSWDLRDWRGAPLAVHTGQYAGAGALIALVPESNAGVVVLANGTAGIALGEAIGMEAVDALLGREVFDATSRLLEVAPRMFAPDGPDTSRGSLTAPARSYAGSFFHPDWGTLEVTARADSLAGRIGSLPMPFRLTGEDRFRAGSGYDGAFEKDARGRVTAVWMNLDPDSVRFARK